MTVAIIEAFPVARRGLIELLKMQFANTDLLASKSINDFCSLYAQQNPDIILIGIDGFSSAGKLFAIYKLKKQYPKSSVIVYDEEMDMHMGLCYLKAGVDGYLLKRGSVIELILCIQMVLEGKKYICEELSELAIKHYLI